MTIAVNIDCQSTSGTTERYAVASMSITSSCVKRMVLPGMPISKYYLNKLRETVEIDIFKCYCTFLNEAERQYVGKKHNEVPARVTLVRMMPTL